MKIILSLKSISFLIALQLLEYLKDMVNSSNPKTMDKLKNKNMIYVNNNIPEEASGLQSVHFSWNNNRFTIISYVTGMKN
jgi:hypothetical protein